MVRSGRSWDTPEGVSSGVAASYLRFSQMASL